MSYMRVNSNGVIRPPANQNGVIRSPANQNGVIRHPRSNYGLYASVVHAGGSAQSGRAHRNRLLIGRHTVLTECV